MVITNLFDFLRSIDKDLINSGFELAGGFFALNHCRVLYADKGTRGVSLLSAAFFITWGFWNLFYYTALLQPLSFYGAVFLVSANSFYMGLMLYFRKAGVPSSKVDEDCLYWGVEAAMPNCTHAPLVSESIGQASPENNLGGAA